MYERLLRLPKSAQTSFFLWGPRQSGKSTYLRHEFIEAFWIDLLKSDVFLKYASNPERLREEVLGSKGNIDWIVIDEVQKLPSLLDEVHWLIENTGVKFVLCGSSARKLKRSGVNLLGGRALIKQLFGLVTAEMGRDFNLERVLNNGYLPSITLQANPLPFLSSYAGTCLQEEISAEALVRNIQVFSAFLKYAAMSDTEPVNYSSFAGDVGVSSQTISQYYEILIDTLLGSWLPLYKYRPKRRIQGKAKFYFSMWA